MTHRWARNSRVLVLLAFVLCLQGAAQATDPSWTQAIPPFRIAGNLYYVGSKDLASYLIATPEGNILINSTVDANVPLIQSNVKRLGFRFSEIKILLISHAHNDHCGGSARIKKLTGASYAVMAGDVPLVESGGKADYLYANDASMHFSPTKVDRVLHDGDTVQLGGMVLTAHLTAGHTKGTTTWTFDVIDKGKSLHVVIVGGPNVNGGDKLVGNRTYPQIATDFQHEFAVLNQLPCDVFLGAHGGYFGLDEKIVRMNHGEHDVFVDPGGYKAYIADRKRAFEAELARQTTASR